MIKQKKKALTSKKAVSGEQREAPLGEALDFATSEAYNMLRTNLSFAFPGKTDGRVVGITSAAPQAGKSYTAINLCYALAKDGHRTVLVSADMRKPTIERKLGLTLSPGLSEILAGNLPAEREHPLIRPCLHENLSVITAGELPPNPSELIGSAQMVSLVEALKKKFEYVVLDLPPVTSVIDPVAVSPCIDGMIVVVRHGLSRKALVTSTMNQLRYANVRVIGFVYNGIRAGGLRGSFQKYKKYYHNSYETTPSPASETGKPVTQTGSPSSPAVSGSPAVDSK